MIVSGSNVIGDSSQVNAGVINSEDIADDSIVNADINTAAAIAYSKLNLALSIVNADISASAAIAKSKLAALEIANADVAAAAAIVDTKLATIATAGKVSGAALTSLASIPSGAGVIPAANVPPPSVTRGTTTLASGSTTQTTIAHGLGKIPAYIELHVSSIQPNGGADRNICIGSATAVGAESCVWSGAVSYGQSTTQIVRVQNLTVTTSGALNTLDATNIKIDWTGSDHGTIYINWVAFG